MNRARWLSAVTPFRRQEDCDTLIFRSSGQNPSDSRECRIRAGPDFIAHSPARDKALSRMTDYKTSGPYW